MNPTIFRSLLLAAACAVALSACQPNDEPETISNGQPGGVPVAIQVGPTRDPSLPDASAVAVQMAADKAREDALAQEPATPPGDKPMASQSNVPLTPAPEGTKLN
jgi:hypothetical protein